MAKRYRARRITAGARRRAKNRKYRRVRSGALKGKRVLTRAARKRIGRRASRRVAKRRRLSNTNARSLLGGRMSRAKRTWIIIDRKGRVLNGSRFYPALSRAERFTKDEAEAVFRRKPQAKEMTTLARERATRKQIRTWKSFPLPGTKPRRRRRRSR